MVIGLHLLGIASRRLAKAAVLLAALSLFVAGLVRMNEAPSLELRAAAPLSASGALRVRVLRRLTPDGGEVDGRLSFPDARVRVFHALTDERYALVATGRTDAQGRLALSDVPTGYAWLLVDAPGMERWSRGVVIEAGGPPQLNVELQPAQPLAVEVRDESGNAVAGATVVARSPEALPFGGVTGADGRLTFARVPPGPLKLEVYARGFEPARRDRVEHQVEVDLRALGGLEVRVLAANGDRAPGAEVVIVGSSLWPARRLQADQQGVARIPSLPAGIYDLRARHGSRVSAIASGIRLERAEQRRVELRLMAGRYVEVQVRAAQSDPPQPIVGAKVVLAEYGLSAFPVQAVTDDQGHVRLGPIPDGPAYVSVRADDYIGRGAVAVPSGAVDPLVVELRRGATLRGRVVDAQGRPVDGARVEVVGVDLDGQPIAESPLMSAYRDAHFDYAMRPLSLLSAGELGVTLGPIPYVSAILEGHASASGPGGFAELPESYAPWVTRYDGEFTAAPVPPGRLRAIIRHPKFLEASSRLLDVAPGGEAFVEVVLGEGYRLLGRVVDERGLPVPGVRVAVTGTTTGYERSVTSAKDGTFRLASVPGEVAVALARANDPTRFVRRRVVQLTQGEPRELEFELPEPRGPLSLLVTNAQGQPLELAQVSVHSVDPQIPVRSTRFTDATGRVEVPAVRGIAARLLVKAPGHIDHAEQFTAVPEALEVSLSQGVTVRGAITAVRGRLSVVGARVTLESGNHRDSTLSSGVGQYEFRNVPLGPATLNVVHEAYARVRQPVRVQDPGHPGRAFELPDVDLPDPTAVSGVVVDSTTEQPVAGAWVGLDELTAPGQPHASGDAVVTDAQGRFVLKGLAPGVHQLYASSRVHGRGTVEAQVQADRPLDGLRINLERDAVEDSANEASAASVAVRLEEQHGGGDVRLLVRAVAPQSEAERAGLLPGDVLVSVDGAAPASRAEAWRRLSGRLGTDVVVGVSRSGQRHDFRVRRESTR